MNDAIDMFLLFTLSVEPFTVMPFPIPINVGASTSVQVPVPLKVHVPAKTVIPLVVIEYADELVKLIFAAVDVFKNDIDAPKLIEPERLIVVDNVPNMQLLL